MAYKIISLALIGVLIAYALFFLKYVIVGVIIGLVVACFAIIKFKGKNKSGGISSAG